MKKFKIHFVLLVLVLTLIPVNIKAEEERDVDVLSVEELEDIKRPGTYFVNIKSDNHNGESIDKIIRITVTNPKTIIDQQTREGIHANDFRVNPIHFDTMSAENFIDTANAYAWNLDTGNPVAIVDVDIKPSENFQSDYIVTFSTKNKTSITTKLYLRENILRYDSLEVNMNEIKRITRKQLNIIIFSIIISPIISLIFLYVYFKKKIKSTEKTLYQ